MRKSQKILIGLMSAVLLAGGMTACSKSGSENTQKTKPAQSANPEQTVEKSATPSGDETTLDHISYTLGYSVGHNITAELKGQGVWLENAELLEGFKAGMTGQTGKFTDAKMKTIMRDFQQQIMQKQQAKQVAGILKNAETLLNNSKTPFVGPKDAKVAVIEFFDYNCLFCSKMALVMEKVMDGNPNVKYLFKEFPIFGQRWKTSQYAAEMGIAVYVLKGADAYLKYHNAVFATGDDEGKLTMAEIKKAAENAGVNLSEAERTIKDKNISDEIRDDLTLGLSKLGIQGTPMIIVMPTTGANAGNTSVIPGYVSQKTIQQAIDKAQNKTSE